MNRKSERIKNVMQARQNLSQEDVLRDFRFLEHTFSNRKEFDEAIEKYISGVSIDYIIGFREFMGNKIFISNKVLIPRDDTECWVNQAIKYIIVNNINRKTVLDIFTGSGCIGISAAKSLPDVMKIDFADISEDALQVVEENIIKTGIQNKSRLIKTDVFENICDRYDVIFANPPYVESENIDLENDEPKIALIGGLQGMDFYKIMAKGIENHITSSTHIFLEIGALQKKKILNIFERYGLKFVKSFYDFGGVERCLVFKVK